MKRPLKHVKWAEKPMPSSNEQLAFEEAIRQREKRRTSYSTLTYAASLKRNTGRISRCYTPNNYAEMQYKGTLSDGIHL